MRARRSRGSRLGALALLLVARAAAEAEPGASFAAGAVVAARGSPAAAAACDGAAAAAGHVHGPEACGLAAALAAPASAGLAPPTALTLTGLDSTIRANWTASPDPAAAW